LQRSYYKALKIDLTAPSTPTLTLLRDTGYSDSDGITTVGTVTVGGLDVSARWMYSTDNGATWIQGIGDSFTLASGRYAAGQIVVKQVDEAGNFAVGTMINAVTVAVGGGTITLGVASSAQDGVTTTEANSNLAPITFNAASGLQATLTFQRQQWHCDQIRDRHRFGIFGGTDLGRIQHAGPW